MCFKNQHSNKQEEQTCVNNQLDAVKQYELIINARNFHYQEFNKWSRYFGLVVSALFVAYYKSNGDMTFHVLVALLGYIVSMCWYWSNKGYTYWWIHWSKYLMYVEKQLPHNFSENSGVYGSFCQSKKDNEGNTILDEGDYECITSGANISTSKVLLMMSFLITMAWGFVLCDLIFCKIKDIGYCHVGVSIVSSIALTFLLSKFSEKLKSDMSKHIPIDANR